MPRIVPFAEFEQEEEQAPVTPRVVPFGNIEDEPVQPAPRIVPFDAVESAPPLVAPRTQAALADALEPIDVEPAVAPVEDEPRRFSAPVQFAKGIAQSIQSSIGVMGGGALEFVGDVAIPQASRLLNKVLIPPEVQEMFRKDDPLAASISDAGRDFRRKMITASYEGWEAPDPELEEASWRDAWLPKAAGIIGRAIPSYGSAIGITLLTKNPTAGAALLGGQEAFGTYTEAKDAGVDPDDAAVLGMLNGAWSTATERIPFQSILGNAGRRLLVRIGKGATTETVQELVQMVGSNLIEKFGYDEGRKIHDGWLETLIATPVLGGAAGGFVGPSVMQNPEVTQAAERLQQVAQEISPEEDVQPTEIAPPEIVEDLEPAIEPVVEPEPAVVDEIESEAPTVVEPDVVEEPVAEPAPPVVEEVAEVIEPDEAVPPPDPMVSQIVDEAATPDAEPLFAETETDDQRTRRRQFAERLQADESIRPEIREGLLNIDYVPISNEVTTREADAIIGAKGPDLAASMVKSESPGLQPRVRVTMAQRLIRHFNEAANQASAANDIVETQRNVARAIDIADGVVELGTRLGQGVEAFTIWNKLSPEAVLVKAQRTMRKRAPRPTTGETAPTEEQLRLRLDTAGRETVDKVSRGTKNKGRQTRAKRSATRRITKQPELDVAIWTRYKRGLARQVFSRIDNVLQPNRKLSPALQDFTNRLRQLVNDQLALEQAPPKTRAVDAAKLVIQDYINNTGKYRNAVSEAKQFVKKKYKGKQDLLAKIDDIFAPVLDKPFTDRQLRNMASEALQDMDADINRIVREGLTEERLTKQQLADRLLKDVGLTLKDAQWFADDIRGEFNQRASVAKERILKGMLSRQQQKRVSKSRMDRIIELSNLGALTKAEYDQLVSDMVGVPRLTPAQGADLVERARDVQRTPEGFQQNEKIIELMTEIDRMSGKPTVGDIGTSLWYANILSGYQTQQRNIIDTAINSVFDTVIAAGVNRENPLKALAVLLRGGITHGGVEAGAILRTGRPRARLGTKLEGATALEAQKFKGGKWNPLNYWKYVMRAMQAEDAVFYKGAKDAQAWILARRLAKQEGLKGKELSRRVEAVLGTDPAHIAEFKAQAKEEGLTGQDALRRVTELQEQIRPADIADASTDFAARATYNYQPEGALGIVADAVANTTRRVPAMKLIVPFTRIVANVTNRSLDYTPWGFKRAFAGHTEQATKHTKEQRATHIAKAIVGTTAMAMAYALDAEYSDDDDPYFQITARGPADRKKNFQLRETGWKPWSVKIGDKYIDYRLTPMAIPFAIIGGVRDAERWDKLDEEDILNRSSAAVVLAGSAILNQSFLRGVADWFEIFNEDNPAQSVRAINRALGRVSGAPYPNLLRQIDRVFDPTITEGRNLKEAMLREIPFARREGKPILNMLGEPARLDTALMFGKKRGDKVWDLLVDKEAWIPVPQRGQVSIYDSEGARKMEPNEFYDYIKISGAEIRRQINENYSDLQRMDDASVQRWVRTISGDARTRARAKIAGL